MAYECRPSTHFVGAWDIHRTTVLGQIHAEETCRTEASARYHVRQLNSELEHIDAHRSVGDRCVSIFKEASPML